MSKRDEIRELQRLIKVYEGKMAEIDEKWKIAEKKADALMEQSIRVEDHVHLLKRKLGQLKRSKTKQLQP